MNNENEKTEESGTKKWCWYYGVLFYAGVQVASFGLGNLVQVIAKQSQPQLPSRLPEIHPTMNFITN